MNEPTTESGIVMRAQLVNPDPAATARAELMERYKLAIAEYRAEVTLGTERQKLFMGLNPAVAAFAVVNKDAAITVVALMIACAASIAGILIVSKSHARYVQTRYVLLRLAGELGFGEDWQTTGGMREARGEMRLEGLKVTAIIRSLLGLYAITDVVAVAWLLAKGL